MKKYRYILLFVFTIHVFLMSCVEDADFKVPENLGVEENQKLTSLLDSIEANKYQLKTIEELKSLFVSGNAPLQITSDIVVKGYVISSDKNGNFYKEFYMQDAVENPVSGIKIAVNLSNSYNTFNIGREVYIYLKDLYLGETNSGDGIMAIGGKIKSTDLKEVVSISSNQLTNHLFRSSLTATIIPKKVVLSNVNKYLGTYVSIENVFFAEELKGASYVDVNEDFDTQRKIVSCEGFGYTDMFVETSSFSNFANETLPTGGGMIAGVVSKDFGGDFTVLVLNDTQHVYMNEEKCIPLDIDDFTVFFEENFEEMTSSNPLEGNGWISFAEEGNYNWRVQSSSDSGNSGSKIATMGAYNSGTINIAWLISPAISLDSQEGTYLNFESSNSFADDSELELLISTDWNGDENTIDKATWSTLPGTIVSDDTYYQDWVSSGAIDLSSYLGTVHIAFRYVGGDNSGNNAPNTSTTDGTFEIDNFKILIKK